jgi:hypothetical protein
MNKGGNTRSVKFEPKTNRQLDLVSIYKYKETVRYPRVGRVRLRLRALGVAAAAGKLALPVPAIQQVFCFFPDLFVWFLVLLFFLVA